MGNVNAQSPQGFIYQHEEGLDADGVALPYSMTLSPYGTSKGGKSNFQVEYLVNDFFGQIGDVTQTLTSYDRLNNSTLLETEVETIAPTDSEPVDCRISGRYIGFAVGGSSLGCYVRLGLPVVFIRRIGERS